MQIKIAIFSSRKIFYINVLKLKGTCAIGHVNTVTDKVGTAVIGLGTIGSVHADWYSQILESKLVAVCDVRENVVKEFEAKYKVKGYTDYMDLLEDKRVEAVTIAVPHYLHSKVAIEAAKAGKHVAVEKPMCKTLEEANDMVKTVKKAGVCDLYMENLCFAPSFKLAKDIIDKGGLGNVYLCRARESEDLGFGSATEKATVGGKMVAHAPISSWYFDYEKTGGGALMSDGCHAVQYIRYIFDNAPPQKVYAEILYNLGMPKPKGIEDAALVVIRFKGNKIGVVETSFYATGGYDDTAEIYGNKGTIFLDIYKRNPIIVHSHAGYDMTGHSIFSSVENADKGWSFPIPEERFALGYYHEQRHFLQSILKGKRPTVNFDDGKATLEIMLAAYKSHQTGKAESLPLT